MTNIRLLGLYAGGISILEPEGLPSGIIKQAITTVLAVTSEGIHSDVQADRKVHGGPEKALHHFAADNFSLLRQQFPLVAVSLQPGSIGENISTQGITEKEACIGDRFRLGNALIEISQPRRPCWKIDSRYQQDGLAQYIARAGITGWYYRVLEEGEIHPDSTLTLQTRPHPDFSIQSLNDLGQETRPPLDRLEAFARLPALNVDWRQRLEKRLHWLRRHG